MSYQIKFNYNTGNSFNQEYGLEDVLELEWEDINNAKANLIRIKEHYQFNRDLNSYNNKSKNNREKFIEEISKKDWYTKDRGDFNCLILYTDSGKPFKFWPTWMGYFQSLNYAEIISKVEDGLKIEF